MNTFVQVQNSEQTFFKFFMLGKSRLIFFTVCVTLLGRLATLSTNIFDGLAVGPINRKVFQLFNAQRMTPTNHKVLIKQIDETGIKDNTSATETKASQNKVEFINPMVFDRLGTQKGLFELKYLALIPMNGDPPLLIPGTNYMKIATTSW